MECPVKRLFLLFTVFAFSIIAAVPENTLCFQEDIPVFKRSVSGSVLNSETGEPLYLANVFLANTTLGAASDPDGVFTIYGIPEGTYSLIVTFLGYEPVRRTIRLNEGSINNITISMIPKEFTSDQIVVEAKDTKEWKKDLDRFTGIFLGTSENSKQCVILNPEILSFTKDIRPGYFSAEADDILRVEDWALGYRIEILFEEFVLENQSIWFKAEHRFFELSPADEKEKEKWETNREKAYLGSRRHFLASLVNGQYRHEGFLVDHVDRINEKSKGSLFGKIDWYSPISETGRPGEWKLNFKDYLRVEYENEKEPREYINSRILTNLSRRVKAARRIRSATPKNQTSWLELKAQTVRIDKRGNINDPYGLAVFGYWSWLRIADALPLNYEPPKEQEPKAESGSDERITKQAEDPEAEILKLADLKNRERKAAVFSDPEYSELVSALDNDPRNQGVLNEFGYLFIKYDHYDSARFYFRKSLKLNPNQPDSYTGIGLSLLKEGPRQNVITGLAEKLLMLTAYRRAERELKKVLKFDPAYGKARIVLADVYRAMGSIDKKKKALAVLEELVEVNPEYPEAYYKLGEAQYELRRYEDAEISFRKQFEYMPGHIPSYTFLGRAYSRLGKDEEASENYLASLPKLADPDKIDEIFNYMYMLCTDEEKEKYESLPYAKRGEFFADFWRRKDPNILTPVNERLIEHLERVDLVQKNYNARSARGYDDRGEIYLKYGEPDEKYVSTGAGNESWLYSSIDKNLAFDYVGYGGYFVNVNYFDNPGFYLERQHMGGIYELLAAKVFGRNSEDAFRAIVSEVIPYKYEAVEKAPPEHHKYVYPEERFDLPLTIMQFRGSEDRTDVELQYAVPYNKLNFKDQNGQIITDIEMKIVIQDTAANTLDEVKRNFQYRLIESENPLDQFALGREQFNIPPDTYTIGLEVSPEGSNRNGTQLLRIPVKDYSGRDLLASDILICWEDISDRDLNRTSLNIRPYPFLNVFREQPLVLYYEIYNLSLGGNDLTSYTTTYSIKQQTVTKKEGDFKKFFKGLGRLLSGKSRSLIEIKQDYSGIAPDGFETISLDISKLPPGEAVITITVLDKTTGRSVSTSRPITIME